MTISKKLSAFVLAGMMMASTAAQSFAALPSDALETPYGEAIETLGALDIMVGDDDGLFRPGDTIRRSEFAKVAVEAMGLGSVAQASGHKTQFPDVVENHWANGYINVATSQGIVIGDDEGNFRPDDAISYAEAMTVLVRIIGHEPAAENKGGFPGGYLSVGTQAGISKNAVGSANEDVSRGMVAQMTFNALTAKMMEQVGFGNNERYEIVDKTLLYDYLDVTKAEGQISAIGISSLAGTSTLRDNEVRIGDKTYTVSEEALPAVRNLLGFNVTYYVRELNSGKMQLILARADENKNSATIAMAGSIESVTENGDGTVTVEYWQNKDDRKTKEITVKADAQMIYNGKGTSFDKELLSPESGRITALDIDADDKADIVFVTAFSNLVVESVLEKSHKITDKYGKPSLVLDPENDDVKFTMTRGGKLVSLSDLKEWDVLSVAKSVDGSIVNIEVSSEKISGKVTEILEDKRVIDGKEYEIAKNFEGEIRLNDEGTFYLDVEGKIAAVDTATALSTNYAYAVMGALTEGFDNYLEIKVFNKEGETVILKSGEKIKLNGTSGKTPAQVLAALKGEDGAFSPQLITYELTGDGVLKEVNTAQDLSGTGSINKNKFSLNATGEMTFKKASGKLGAYKITDSTLILNIPEGATDPEEYSVESKDFFDDNEPYNVFIFDAGEDFAAKAVIVTNSTASASLEAPLSIVDKITSTFGENGETVEKLYVYQGGELVSFEALSEDLLKKESGESLSRGDIVQLKLNNKKEITSVRILFEAAEKDEEFTETTEDLSIVYGKVVKKFASSINVQVGDGAVSNYSLDNVTVYEFDSSKKKNPIRVVDANEITQYDEADRSRVLIKIYKDAVSEIVIVK